MRSVWTGSVEGAFFDGEKFDRNRIIKLPEYQYSGKSSERTYYILSVDVGRKGCQTVVCVLKVEPGIEQTSLKRLVNMYTFNEEHFEDQAIKIKKLYYKYKARRIVIDGNGLRASPLYK